MIRRDESVASATRPDRAWTGCPARSQVRLWRTVPSTRQDRMATAPTEELTLRGACKTGGGSEWDGDRDIRGKQTNNKREQTAERLSK